MAWGYDTCGYRLGKFEGELVVFGMRKAHRDKFRYRRTDGGLNVSWTGPDSCSGMFHGPDQIPVPEKLSATPWHTVFPQYLLPGGDCGIF